MKLVDRSVTASCALPHLAWFVLVCLACCLQVRGHVVGQEQEVGAGPTTATNHLPVQFEMRLYPPKIDHLLVHSELDVHINCSVLHMTPSMGGDQPGPTTRRSLDGWSAIGNNENKDPYELYTWEPDDIAGDGHISWSNVERHDQEQLYNRTYIATIRSQDVQVAIVSGPEPLVQRVENRTDEVVLEISPWADTMFTVRAQNIGQTLMVIQVRNVYSYVNDPNKYSNTSTLPGRLLSTTEYHITVVRRLRTVDVVFDVVVAVAACVDSFSMGCLTDWASLRHHLRHPAALLLGLACQFLVMPSMALGLAKTLCMGREQGLGLFYVACVPAGGAGHIVVSILSGDRALSVALNFFSCVLAVGSAPLWIFGLGRFLGQREPSVHLLINFELWLVGSAIAYVLGTLLHYMRPNVAAALLNWLVKPWLLLFTIVFSTIGMYINVYMFAFIDPVTPIAAGLLPMLGSAVGVSVAVLSRQDSEYLKTITTEATFSNCMLVLAMVRFTLPQPEADMVATMPMWVIFLMPIPFILTFIMQTIKRVLIEHCDRRREKKYRNFSIVSSLLNVTNVSTLSASLTPKLNSPVDDSSVLIDEKVTVL